MLPGYARKTNIGLGVGILLNLAGRSMVAGDAPGGGLLAVVGAGFFIWGCAQYAKGKGYSPWLGALGLLSILGLIILVVIPDKHKQLPA